MEYTKKIKNDVATVNIVLDANEFEMYVKEAYELEKSHYSVEGFRKGKVPKAIIEKMYGKEIFYDKAFDLLLRKEFNDIMKKEEFKIVSEIRPSLKKLDDKGIELEVEVDLYPTVTLGQYEGMTFKKEVEEITEEMINNELKETQKKGQRLIDIKEDGVVQVGDHANIDFEGKIDGVAFEGGTGKKYDLEIGSHSFIDDFEDQLVGMKIGETRDVNVRFPANYGVESLNDKPAVFTVVLNGIKRPEYPELNDEFASNYSEYETLEEWKDKLKEKMKKEKDEQAEMKLEGEIIDKIIENSTLVVHNSMIEDELDGMMKSYDQNLMRQGLNLELYCKYTNTTVEKIKESVRGQAKHRIEQQLVLTELVKKENITSTDEEVDQLFREEAERAGRTYEEDMKVLGKNEQYHRMLQNEVIFRKLYKLLKEKNIIE